MSSPVCSSVLRSLGGLVENLGCPNGKFTLSATLMKSKGKDCAFTVWHRSGCRSCREIAIPSINRLRDSSPDFLLGFTPLAFASPKATTRQWCYFTHNWGIGSLASGHIHTPVGHACRTLGVKPPPDFSSGTFLRIVDHIFVTFIFRQNGYQFR